MTSVSSQI